MAKITYLPDAKTVEATPREKLIDVCERENLGVPFGCQNGLCGTCLSRIVKGQEHLKPAGDKERNTLELFTQDKQHRLLCQCSIKDEGEIEIDNP